MQKSAIMDILNDWNFWNKEIDTGIKRESYLKKIQTLEKTGQIITITGARRSGKSTIILQYAKALIESGIESKNILYINLEEPRYYPELSLKFLQDIYDAYKEYLEPSRKPHIFLDEVQNIPFWERFVRSLHERKEAMIIVTGSSSKLWSGEVGTVLTGRTLGITVYPLNFREFLGFHDIELKNKMDIITKKVQIKKALREYINFGGFPLVVLKEEKTKILQGYFDDIINRDVVYRFKIRMIDKIKTLANYYLTNISSPITFNRIRKFLNVPLDTVMRYSYFLNNANLIFFIKKFSYSLKEQEVNPRKVYCIDTGLRNAVCFNTSTDIGKLYENIVFMKLVMDGYEVYYWKNKRECDFIVKSENKLKAIQVCYDIEKAKEREVEGLLETLKLLKLSEGVIVTEEYEDEKRVDDKKIRFVPLWKFLWISDE